jgi:aminopeptidase
MKDLRIETLAKNLINYSTELKKGEKVLIETVGFELPLTKELIKEAYRVGAEPFVTIKNPEIMRLLFGGASIEHVRDIAGFEIRRMKEMDAYIGIRCSLNSSEFSSLTGEQLRNYSSEYQKKVHSDIRVPDTKWVILRYPNESMAQSANMSTEDFEDLYFQVCNLDYSKMSKAMDPLVELINRTEKVRLTARGTDLEFSIKGLPAIKCDGKLNIPDGEVFTAPIKDSVNGYITYNTPSVHDGFKYENICFRIKDGKITEATANNTDRINDVLDTDEGSRYFGEFSIGLNPYINEPMLDTLFDEKIFGSIHFTPGNAYEECDNGNKSATHWDLVLIQRPEYGGGEIWFDDVLIRKDGIFVVKELLDLNPENLK